MLNAKPLLPLLIEPEALNDALIKNNNQTILLVDLRTETSFLSGHIKGAQLVTPSETQAAPPIPGLLPTDEQLSHLMQRIGLTKDSHVVVYDDEGGGWAGRFIWLLDEIGHSQYSYLNGGILSWSATNLPLSTEITPNSPSEIMISRQSGHSVCLDDLMQSVSEKRLQIWDARSPKEYNGEKVNAMKGGHIPGALNYEWTNAMDRNNHLKLKPLDTILKELYDIGISPDKETVTHCQSHHRSGLTYLLGKLLNFKSMKAYPGSWGEWGNHPNTPVEKN